MTDIPDEAVQAAWDIIQDRDGFEDVRDALAAALPHLLAVPECFPACQCGECHGLRIEEPFRRSREAMRARIAELEDGIASLGRAISNQGPVPRYHRQVMADHRREWPTLWRAIDDLRALLPDDDRYPPSDDQPQIGDFRG